MIGTGFHLSKRARDHHAVGQSISLTAQEFDRLSHLADDTIQPFMEQRADAVGAGESFTISSETNSQYSKKVTLGIFNDCPSCNVRLYCRNGQTPCKPGVALTSADWASVKACLSRSPEALLASDVYTALLHDVLQRGVKDTCEGCVQDHPSQRRHTCLDERRKLADGEEAHVPYADFLETIASRARFEGVVVADPYRWFQHMRVHVRELAIRDFEQQQQETGEIER